MSLLFLLALVTTTAYAGQALRLRQPVPAPQARHPPSVLWAGGRASPGVQAGQGQVATESPLPTPALAALVFRGQSALQFAADQMGFGPRPTGSEAHRQTGDYIKQQLEAFGWSVVFQEFDYLDTPARNIIATKGQGRLILLGAHYDTRRRADRDPSDPAQPVPGASDGASGVAVLLELARVLNVEATGHRIQLAFFDAEDNGGLDGWDWIAGSRYMAQFEDILHQVIAGAWGWITGSGQAPDNLSQRPEAMILLDMVGDIDQQLYWELNSNADLNQRVWQVAAELGYGAVFVPQPRHSLLDDHTPFLERGIPAIDIIDFDYPYWHTTQDTLDKIGADSLERVGRTLQVWLERGAP